ncbi:MAG TPA: hypothetical protein DCO79_13710 [Spirochaeta sp.]|nr:hypothetical protein [Spirochaeta sp.]
MSGFLDYYKLLQVSADASADEIKAGFRKLAHEYHPDKNIGNPDAEIRFRLILEAYNALSSSQGRADYDNYLRTSSVVKKQHTVRPCRIDADAIIENIKSQLNFILWEIEDIISDKEIELQNIKINGYTAENRLTFILSFFDKWILHPVGMGDYFYTARKLDVKTKYNPLDNELNRAHKPYVDLEDYFFQIRRRFDRFLNKFAKNDLQHKIQGVDITMLDCIFEAVNLSFHYLGNINIAGKGENLNFSPYVFSKTVFDDDHIINKVGYNK